MLFHLVLGAICAYALCRRLTDNHLASLVGGVVYGFSPLFLSGIFEGVIEVCASGWLPLFLLLFLKVVEGGSTDKSQKARRGLVALGASAVLWAMLMSNFYYAFAALMTAAFLTLLTSRGRDIARRASVIAAIALPAFLAAIPYVYFLGQSMHSPDCLINVKSERVVTQVYENPHYSSNRSDLLWSFFAIKGKFNKEKLDLGKLPNHVGILPMLLTLIGAWKRKSNLVYLWGAIFFLLAFSGPFLCVNGVFPTIHGKFVPMPSYLFKYIPYLKMATSFYRFHIGTVLFLSVGAAAGTAILIRNQAGPRPHVGAWLICLVILGGYLAFSPLPYPLPALECNIPQFYVDLRDSKGKYGVIDLPAAPQGDEVNDLMKRMYVFYQLAHGKGIIYDFHDREPLRLGKNVLIRDLMNGIGRRRSKATSEEYKAAARELLSQRFRYIVLHARYYDPEVLGKAEAILREIVGNPVQTGDVRAYRLRPRWLEE
jgi:hypothetical protein